jgi:Zn-dependent protease with chaperone function
MLCAMAPLARFRYPTETTTLATTLAVSTALIIALSSFTVGGVAIVVLLGFLFTYSMVLWRTWRLKKTATRSEEAPEIHAIVEQCRERLGVRDPIRVYIVNASVVNAYAVGFRSPQSIVLYTGLLRAFDRDELAYVIGHEMGHVLFRHTTIHALTGQLGLHTFGIPVLGYFLRYIFYFWMRVSEFSADRAGLIACGKLEKGLSTHLKLTLGPERGGRVDVAPIIAHWRAHDVGVADQLKDILSTHPGAQARMDKMVDFAYSGAVPELAK